MGGLIEVMFCFLEFWFCNTANLAFAGTMEHLLNKHFVELLSMLFVNMDAGFF